LMHYMENVRHVIDQAIDFTKNLRIDKQWRC
jgi:hypothetical protein